MEEGWWEWTWKKQDEEGSMRDGLSRKICFADQFGLFTLVVLSLS